MGARCKIRLRKFSDLVCGGFSKDQGYGDTVCTPQQWYDTVPELTAYRF